MQPISTVPGYARPLGYQQINHAQMVAAQGLTLPTVINGQPLRYAVIQNNGTTNVRWRDDGTNPTTTVGMVLPTGSELDYSGDFTNIKFIDTGAGGSLDISYYA